MPYSYQIAQTQANVGKAYSPELTIHVKVDGSGTQKRNRHYNDEKRIAILREADRASFEAIARKYGIAVATLQSWRRKFRGEEAVESAEVVALRNENERLRKLLAARDLQLEALLSIKIR